MLRLASQRTRGQMKPYQSARDAALDFNFSAVSGYYLHLRADFGITVSDGTGVTTWPDVSGNNRNATQASASLRPQFKTGIINGYPVLRFDGTDDFFTLGNIAKMPNFSAYCVWKTTNTAVRQWVYGSLDSGGSVTNAWGTMDYLDTTNSLRYFISDGTNSSSGTAGTGVMTNNVFVVTSQRYTNGTTQEEWWKNGASLAVTTTATAASTNSSTASGYSLGRPGDLSAAYFGGDIAEYLLCNTAHSDVERTRIEIALRAKYAL